MVFLGLGSNIGDRVAFLEKAIDALFPFLSSIICSPFYESSALVKEDAPEAWQHLPYINCVVKGETDLSPQNLLIMIKHIEQRLGRIDRGRWAPREIDIDILTHGSYLLDTPNLTLPHPELIHRDFVLKPLSAVAPEWIYPKEGPCYGFSAQELLRLLEMETNLN